MYFYYALHKVDLCTAQLFSRPLISYYFYTCTCKTDNITKPVVNSKLDFSEFEARLVTIFYIKLTSVQPALYKN